MVILIQQEICYQFDRSYSYHICLDILRKTKTVSGYPVTPYVIQSSGTQVKGFTAALTLSNTSYFFLLQFLVY